jgi:rhomboid family GlyGly-CTERM serine protease
VALIAYVWPDFSESLVYERQAILEGDVWRLVTAVFVHFSLSHMFWDMLVFAAAGLAVEASGYRGFLCVCGFAAIVPGIYFLLTSPEITRYGGLSGLATGAVAYLCLCKVDGAGRDRIPWLAILALLCMKIAVESVSHVSIFVVSKNIPIHVLPSVHAIGCVGAFIVCKWVRPNLRLEPAALRSAAHV